MIYANELGSPFVIFDAAVNSTCGSNGNGLYLYNMDVSPTNNQLRNNKMAMLLFAKGTSQRMVLDYFYDSSKAGWEACYMHGIYLQD